jgi:hypothetical protein
MPGIVDFRTSMMLESPRALLTGADIVSPVTIEEAHDAEFREAWQDLIDRKLIKWLHDPMQLSDEGIEPPTGTILRLAIDYAEKFRDELLAPPSNVVPDPNGGIVFERRQGEFTEVFHFWDDGTLEYQRFVGTNLVERNAI